MTKDNFWGIKKFTNNKQVAVDMVYSEVLTCKKTAKFRKKCRYYDDGTAFRENYRFMQSRTNKKTRNQ